jgi:hypothetical protein
MKTTNLISILIALAIAAPSSTFAIQKFQRTGEIEKDKDSGYSESQRDPHRRRSNQIKDKTSGAYYNGGYHNKGKDFKPGEWQFVDPAHGGSSKTTKHKGKDKEKSQNKGKKKKEKTQSK